MLQTLRGYGAALLAGSGEQDAADAALTRWAVQVAGQAGEGLRTIEGEAAAAWWLDAEDATMAQVLAWAVEHDADLLLQLVTGLGWWWFLRARLAGQYPLLREAAGRGMAGSGGWCDVQFFAGHAAWISGDTAASLGHFAALRDAAAKREPCRALADSLAGRAAALVNQGRHAEGAEEARRALAVAREIAYPLAQVLALGDLAIAAQYAGDLDGAVRLAGQAGQITAGIPGSIARWCSYVLVGALVEAGDLAAAEAVCAVALAQARDVGDVQNQAILLSVTVILDLAAGRLQDAAAHLREAIQLDTRTARWGELGNALDCCGLLCAATGRPAEAITMWAARAAHLQDFEVRDWADVARRREAPLRQARQVLGPSRRRRPRRGDEPGYHGRVRPDAH
jgi:tetratricopeptide (TPR) repeat protein